jgi:hypothetical protein
MTVAQINEPDRFAEGTVTRRSVVKKKAPSTGLVEEASESFQDSQVQPKAVASSYVLQYHHADSDTLSRLTGWLEKVNGAGLCTGRQDNTKRRSRLSIGSPFLLDQ